MDNKKYEEFYKNSQNLITSGRGLKNGKVWSFNGLTAESNRIKVSLITKEGKQKVRNQLRRRLHNYLEVLDSSSYTEGDIKSFLTFMELFLESKTTCFQPQAIFNGTTLSSQDPAAKQLVEKGTRVLKKVETFFNKSKVSLKKSVSKKVSLTKEEDSKKVSPKENETK